MLQRNLALFLLTLAACGSDVTGGGASVEDGTSEGGEGEGASSQGGATEGGSNEGGAAGHTSGGGGEGGGGGAACSAPANPLPFELGSGQDCFDRIEDGETLPLIAGPQGGYHIWVAFGCDGCDPQLQVKWGVRDVETGEPLPETWESQAVLDLQGGSFRQLAGITLGMPGISWDPKNYPPVPEGTHVVLWAQVVEGEQVVAEDAHEIVVGPMIVWDPCAENPEAPECQTG